jgi:hypothetical protein
MGPNLRLCFVATHAQEVAFQKSQRYIQWPMPRLWKVLVRPRGRGLEGTVTENKHERVDLRL